MQINYAVHSATNTIDVVLQKGAQKLYDKYLNQKLPNHTGAANNHTMMNNLNLQQVNKPTRDKIQSVPLTVIEAAPIDTRAPKRIQIKKQSDRFSTLSPKNTTFCKSTKYQTLISNPQSTTTKNQNIDPQNNSMLLQENFGETTLSFKKDRPMTMQTGRKKRQSNLLDLNSKVEEVEEKRAATCQTRNRKKVLTSKEKMAQMVKIKDEQTPLFKEQTETANRFKRYKMEKMEEQMQKDQERMKIQAYYRNRQKKALDRFQDLKKKIKGKRKQSPTLINIQSINGQLSANVQPKPQQKAHIIQLEFNPEEQKILKYQESKISGVNSTKKSSFVAKLKKKAKITNEQYTNNGERQVSSIPFVSLNCGIALSQSILQATASRRRPADQIKRDQYTSEVSSNRFKSHIPIVNSARINFHATIDQVAGDTARSSFVENTHTLSVDRKDFDTTIQSKRQISGSILWRPRGKSQRRDIRISNKQAFNDELLDMKLKN